MNGKDKDDGILFSVKSPGQREKMLAAIAHSEEVVAARCKVIMQNGRLLVPEEQMPKLAPPPQETNPAIERMFLDNGSVFADTHNITKLHHNYMKIQLYKNRGQWERKRNKPSSPAP